THFGSSAYQCRSPTSQTGLIVVAPWVVAAHQCGLPNTGDARGSICVAPAFRNLVEIPNDAHVADRTAIATRTVMRTDSGDGPSIPPIEERAGCPAVAEQTCLGR